MLWQNKNAVVIGRNQSAWSECRVPLLQSEGVELARRISGGGAVYHDEGNLNFSFFSSQDRLDTARNVRVLADALHSLGLDIAPGGRNDILLPDGKKCSGQAFAHTNGRSLHHGTLLLRANRENIARYLTPRQHKYASKGIPSVAARVGSLTDYLPQLSMGMLCEVIETSFFREYGHGERVDALSIADRETVARLAREQASDAWRLGESPRLDTTFDAQFPFGFLRLSMRIENGIICACKAESDALDADAVTRLESALTRAPYTPDALRERAHGITVVPGLGFDRVKVAQAVVEHLFD